MGETVHHNLKSVSYTHLDVYKRQAIDDSSNLSTPISTKCKQVENDMMSVILKQLEKINSKFDIQSSKFDEMTTQNVKNYPSNHFYNVM